MENGYIESFNGKMRNELLNMERFYTLLEAKVLTDIRRKEFAASIISPLRSRCSSELFQESRTSIFGTR